MKTLNLGNSYTITHRPANQLGYVTQTGQLKEIDGDWLFFKDDDNQGFMVDGFGIKSAERAA